MTIEKGRSWGRPAGDPSPAAVAGSDAELAAMAAEALGRRSHLVARVTAGDLLATLGLGEQRGSGDRFAFPVDLAMAHVIDDPEEPPLPFVAHLIAGPLGGRAWAFAAGLLGHGPAITVAVMNAAWLGEYRLGPRAHPNDGLLDITEGRVGFAERREAARRARSGSHLPHPALRTSRLPEWRIDFDRPTAIRLDGVDRGRCCSVRVTVVPDALTVVA